MSIEVTLDPPGRKGVKPPQFPPGRQVQLHVEGKEKMNSFSGHGQQGFHRSVTPGSEILYQQQQFSQEMASIRDTNIKPAAAAVLEKVGHNLFYLRNSFPQEWMGVPTCFTNLLCNTPIKNPKPIHKC